MATTAAIVSIGDELLAGDVENTNASWLAARLTDFGIDVREIRVVPDEAPTIEKDRLGPQQDSYPGDNDRRAWVNAGRYHDRSCS